MRLSTLDKTARVNHGLITLGSSGLSRDAWYRAIRSGSLIQVHPGVVRLPGSPETHVQRIAAAVLALGDDALLPTRRTPRTRQPTSGAHRVLASHRSAAWLWMHGGDRDRTSGRCEHPVDVIVAGRRRRGALDDVAIHRPTDSGRLTPQRIAGIRCTNILRTLLDVGAVEPELTERLLGHALSTRLVDLAAVEGALLDHARPGRSGVGALRRAVDHWSLDAKPVDSVLELAFDRLIRRFGLPSVEFHPMVEGWEIDFRFVGTRLLVECDGWASHGLQRDQFERDRRRDADLTAAGWIVSRHTYRAITDDGARTAERLRRLLAATGA